MAIRISKCCNAQVENKYWCPKCDRVCKSYEVSSIPVAEAKAKVIDIAAIPYYEQELPQEAVIPAKLVEMPHWFQSEAVKGP